MISKLRGKLSYANVTATLALFVALSAGAYAAVNLERDSVRSKHIKDGEVGRADISPKAKEVGFSFDQPVGTPDTVLFDEAGYRLSAECIDVDGRERIVVRLVVPKPATVASSSLRYPEPGGGNASAFSPSASARDPLAPDTPSAIVDGTTASGNSYVRANTLFIRTGDGVAELSFIAFASDSSGFEACTVSGVFTPPA